MVVIIFVFLLFLSAFFSASETALLSLNKFQLKKMEEKNTISSGRIVALLSRPRRFLFTILTGNTFVNIAASSCATVVSISLFGTKGVGIAIGFALFVLLIFGEVVPKTYAYIFAENFSLTVAYPLGIIIRILTPLRKLLYLITDTVIKRFGFIAPKDTSEITIEEIKSLIKIGHREGVVKEIEKEMIYGVFEFKGQRAKDIMTPRIDIRAVDFDMPQEKVLEYAKDAKHSRLPVYRDSLDNIVGIVYAKDILFNPNTNLKDLIKEAYFVPESERIDHLLSDLQKGFIQMAIVADEYGITTGLVSMEDILEEIVGEIVDEYDKEKSLITKIDQKTYRINGMLRIDKANEELGLNIKTEEADTIGGFISLIMQKIPAENEEINYKKFKFKVSKVEKNRIKEIIVTKQ